jgi:MFS family permease
MGISKLVAAGAMGLMGGISAVGRLVVGGVCDKIGFKNGLIISLGLCCSMILYLILVRNVWMLYVFVVVFSVGYGGKAMALPGLVGDVFGTKSLGMIMGLLATAYGMGGFIGPLLGGWIFAQTHSYVMAFIAGAAFYIASIILSFLVKQEEDLQLPDAAGKPSSIPG